MTADASHQLGVASQLPAGDGRKPISLELLHNSRLTGDASQSAAFGRLAAVVVVGSGDAVSRPETGRKERQDVSERTGQTGVSTALCLLPSDDCL